MVVSSLADRLCQSLIFNRACGLPDDVLPGFSRIRGSLSRLE
jgi:hypothetical protein